MKLQRVHTLLVEHAARGQIINPLPPVPLVIRPIIPGALVTPLERLLDVGSPQARAAFHVTPLARGRLTGARVEVLNVGQVIHEIPLPMKSVSQRLTWVLAALTILAPGFLLYFTKYHPLTGSVVREVHRANVPRPAGEQAPPGAPPAGLPGNIRGRDAAEEQADEPTKKKVDTPAGKDNGAGKEKPKEQGPQKGADKDGPDMRPGGGPPGPGRVPGPPPGPAAPPEPDNPNELVRFNMPGEPGEVLAEEIVKNVPAVPGDFLSEEEKQTRSLAEREKYTRNVARAIGDAYGWLCASAVDHISFYIGAVLLFATCVSFLLHTRLRGRRTGSTLMLTPTEAMPARE